MVEKSNEKISFILYCVNNHEGPFKLGAIGETVKRNGAFRAPFLMH